MPVRGSGWYKRPYRVSYIDPETGRRLSRAYHSKANRDAEAARMRELPSVFGREVVTHDVSQPDGTVLAYDFSKPRAFRV